VPERTRKEKVRDWEYRNLMVARAFEYGILWLLISFVVAFVYLLLNLFHTEPTSARYMLSALVQSQAAIVAIVVSLTLIAVQLTASTYSPRVTRIFLKIPDMWILLFLYGISIFYGLLVLKMVRGIEDLSQITMVNISLEVHITAVYALGISTFVILFLYMRNIINLLNPANIINRLAVEITKEKLLNSEEDPIQLVMDIVHGSIMKYDIATTRVGLSVVTNRVIEAVNSDDDRHKEISADFCHHLRRVASSAARIGDEEAIVAAIKNLTSFMKSEAEKKLEYAAMQAIYSIGTIGMAVSAKGLEYATTESVRHLEEIGKTALHEELFKGSSAVAGYLGEIGKIVAKKEPASEMQEIIYSSETVSLLTEVVNSLLTIGIIGIKRGRATTFLEAIGSLAELTILKEKIVKNVILKYESNVEEQDRKSVQQFKKLYEQELEQLRAE